MRTSIVLSCGGFFFVMASLYTVISTVSARPNMILRKPIIKLSSAHLLALLLLCLLVASFALTRVSGVARILAVAFFGTLVWLIYRKAGLAPRDVGLARSSLLSGLMWGLGAAAVVGLVIFVAASVEPHYFMDKRYHETLPQAIITSLFFIPFATVIFEELVFRGVLLALLGRQYSLKLSVLISSLCFGLWHAFSSLGVSGTLFGNVDGVHKLLTMVVVIAATGTAGAIFCLLRIRSGSIIASMFAHWSINAFALIAAAIVWAR